MLIDVGNALACACCVVVACLAGIMGDFAWRPLVKQV